MPLYPLYIFLDAGQIDFADMTAVKSCTITGAAIEDDTIIFNAEIILETSGTPEQQPHATDSDEKTMLKNGTAVCGKIPAVRISAKNKTIIGSAFIADVLGKSLFPLNLPVFRIAKAIFEKGTMFGTETEQWRVIISSWRKTSRTSENSAL